MSARVSSPVVLVIFFPLQNFLLVILSMRRRRLLVNLIARAVTRPNKRKFPVSSFFVGSPTSKFFLFKLRSFVQNFFAWAF